MTSYTRPPRKAVAKCKVHGCGFVRIFFERNQPATVHDAHITPELRAELSLNQHRRMKHRAKVLINGR